MIITIEVLIIIVRENMKRRSLCLMKLFNSIPNLFMLITAEVMFIVNKENMRRQSLSTIKLLKSIPNLLMLTIKLCFTHNSHKL